MSTDVCSQMMQMRCYAPELGCALGNMELSGCPHWTGSRAPAVTNGTEVADILLPWSGNAMGLSDLTFVSGRAKPITVGIVGPGNAGKTTVLASWYLLLGKGLLLEDEWRFGGSYSLGGWEAVASALTFTPGQSPTFPPHTTSRNARAPGLLHMALRRQNGRLRDFVFADAPGEWFKNWSVDQEAEDATGARWVASHADVLLLVADREALSGPRLGTARSAFQLLAKRVAANRRGRPVALVWTKGDITVDPEMQDSVRRAVANDMPDFQEFSVSVYPVDREVGVGFRELFAWVTQTRRPGVGSMQCSTVLDPLFMVGRR